MTNYKLVCVVAMAENRVIGDGRGLLWHLPGDLKRVKALTMGCPLIMGRKTWDSIGRALPGRASIVLTRDRDWSAEGAINTGSLDEAITAGKNWLAQQGGGENRLILFGGGQIYQMGLPLCQEIDLTRVAICPETGTRFPDLDAGQWDTSDIEGFGQTDNAPAFSYHHLVRRGEPITV